VTNGYINNGRSFAEVMHEFREDLKDFATTRIHIFLSEISEKLGAWKIGLPSMIIGLVLLATAFLLFTAGLVNVIALAFAGQPWGFAVSFFIVMAIYGLAGGLLFFYGLRTARAGGLAPQKTIRVLKEDGLWLKTEARTQL
jgi:putative superfamily III holin-X